MNQNNIRERVKNIIFNAYPHVFDFDVKDAFNGGDELKVFVTFRTSIHQIIPIRVKVIINKKNNSEYGPKRIYITKAEKIQGLKEGRIDQFLSEFEGKEWKDEDINKFIKDNEDIIDSGENKLEKEELIRVIANRKEQKEKSI